MASSTLSRPFFTRSPSQPGLKLLCLDGGGIRGLSILIILEELLNHLKSRGIPEDKRPCEIFDLICGTSTGGLIALLLGPLKMTVPEVIEIYKKLGKKIFKSVYAAKILRFIKHRARLDTNTLEKEIRWVIGKQTGDELTAMNSGKDDDCKT